MKFAKKEKNLLKVASLIFVISLFFVAGVFAAGSPEELPNAYYIHSNSPVLKGLFGVNHEFDGVFSSELSGTELAMVKKLGVKVEPVQIRKINAKPVCGDGICQGNEKRTCSQDCTGGGGSSTPTPTPTPTPDTSTRSCEPSTQVPYGISMVNGASGGSGVTVAVLDTGVKSDHLDLVENITSCSTEVTHSRADSKDCEDAHGHGTHTAGTVAANGGADGLGIYGVAPEANLMIVKVCDRRGWCYGDDMASGINYAVTHGANIISMSIGGDSPDSYEEAAISNAVSHGVLVVAAAGNDGPSLGSIDYPGAFVDSVAVGAIDSSKNVPSWSSRGINDGDCNIEEREVEVGLPGVSVLSTYKDGCYATMSGTSMATPHMAGLAAKLWQGSASATRTHLQNLAKGFDLDASGDDPATGFGLPIAP